MVVNPPRRRKLASKFFKPKGFLLPHCFGHYALIKMNILAKIGHSLQTLKYRLELRKKTHIIEKMNHKLTEAFHGISLLYTVSQYLSAVLDVEGVIFSVKRIFTHQFQCDRFSLHLVSEHTGKLKLVAEQGEGTFVTKPLSVPILLQNELIGVLTVSRHDKDSISLTDRQSLESIASQIAVAYDRARLYSKTRELAVRDDLTGLYNRRHFYQMLDGELKRARRVGRHVSLLMIDADRFKKFNDDFGHLKGDECLKGMASLLKSNLRDGDLLARFGGEEFVVMLTDADWNQSFQVAEKLRVIVQNELKISVPGQDVARATVSIGVSSYPDCASNLHDLIDTADMALYQAKDAGRNQTQCHRVRQASLKLA